MPEDPPCGILPVDKPVGPTSHDMVARLRRSVRGIRIGHGGTLDPAADGLLLLLVGPATRWFDALRHHPKIYRAVVRLGEETDSGDAAGTSMHRSEVPPLVAAGLDSLLAPLRGRIVQEIPPLSAAKHHGKPFHRIVRAGGTPPERSAPVQIHRVALETWTPPDATLLVSCASGTYIRSLAAALGQAAGCGAHLRSLRRLRIGPFRIEDAVPTTALDGMTVETLREVVRDLTGARRATNH